MSDKQSDLPFLKKVADYDVFYQMKNLVRVLTSGVERVARRKFYSSGKWRFVERVRWWANYKDATPVIFGHYWRWWDPASHAKFSKGEPNLFDKDGPCGWQRNKAGRKVAFCIDYSVGKRFEERKRARTGPFESRLAALRWPEREIVFDQDGTEGGSRHCIERPGRASRRNPSVEGRRNRR